MSQNIKIDLFPHTHFIDSVFLENSNTFSQQMPATLCKRLVTFPKHEQRIGAIFFKCLFVDRHCASPEKDMRLNMTHPVP